jgi:hypothetical protein
VIGIGHRHDLISSPIQSLSISDCDPRAAVVIALSLRRQYLQNGNIRGRGWRLSAIAAPRLPNWESRDEIERAESGRLRPMRFRGNLTERRNAGWRRSADRTVLHDISLLSGNLTGNFAISGRSGPISRRKTPALQSFLQQFPTRVNRENGFENRELKPNNREFERSPITGRDLRF